MSSSVAGWKILPWQISNFCRQISNFCHGKFLLLLANFKLLPWQISNPDGQLLSVMIAIAYSTQLLLLLLTLYCCLLFLYFIDFC
jgi:hypothetical protein